MAVSDFHRSMVEAAASGKTPRFRSTSPSTDDVGYVTKKRKTPASNNRPSLLSRKMGTVIPANKVIKKPTGPFAPKTSIRPNTNSRNAYNAKTGRRSNPTLIQTFLDASPTYNLLSGFGRKIRGYADPRG